MARYDKNDFPDSYIELACSEIMAQYGHRVRVGRKTLNKFGRNQNAAVDVKELIAFNGYNMVRSATNSITHFSISNAADNQTLTVEGFTIADGDLTFTTQEITLNGQTKTALTTPVSRCSRVANTSSSTKTADDVYVYTDTAISGGIPTDTSQIAAVMPAEDQSTVQAYTSIAANNYFVCTDFYASIGQKTNSAANIRFSTAPVGGVERTRIIAACGTGANLRYDFSPYLVIPPNTDILMFCNASTNNTDISAGFDGFFADIVS